VALGVGGVVVARARAIIDSDTRGMDKGLDRSEKRFAKWNRVAVKAALGVGVAAAVGAKKAIDAASDLSEEMNKSEVVFGKNGKSILKWSEGSAKAFGASRRAALQYVGGFGAMFRSIGGIADKQMANMSKGLVELGGDLASFYNADTAESLEAMKSALSGQIEPMRRFGVFLTQDRIKAQALSMGLVKASVDMDTVKAAQERVAIAAEKVNIARKKHGAESIQARTAALTLKSAEDALAKAIGGKVPTISAAAKAQATYAIIQKDTAVAHGDFARTADGAANKQRILAAQVEDTKAKLGMGLLPAYEKALGLTSDLVEWGSKHAGIVKVTAGVVVGLAAAILAVNAAWKVYSAVTRAATMAQAAYNIVANANPYMRIAMLILAIGTALVVAYKKSETFQRIVSGVFGAVRRVVAFAVGQILRRVEGFLDALARMARAASKVPIIGDKFKGVAEKVEGARDKVRKLREGLEDLPEEVKVGVVIRTTRVEGPLDEREGDPRRFGRVFGGSKTKTTTTTASVSTTPRKKTPSKADAAEVDRKIAAAATAAAKKATAGKPSRAGEQAVAAQKVASTTVGTMRVGKLIADEIRAQAVAALPASSTSRRSSAPGADWQDALAARSQGMNERYGLGGGAKTVVVNQRISHPKPDQFATLERAKFAASAVFD